MTTDPAGRSRTPETTNDGAAVRQESDMNVTTAEVCHNGHLFEPGIDQDAPDQPDPRWCNTCGEARRG